MIYTMGSLFAGIGGFDLGFERAGFKTVWQVELDPYCTKVLAKNFPEAERFGDIRECGRHNLKPVDVICGGFPCQDVSLAGLRRGISGATRSGLYAEMVRIVSELRPPICVMENVSGLLIPVEYGEPAPISRVLGDLAEVGYDAEWDCIPASAVGAPHERDRVFIIANLPDPDDQKHQGKRLRDRILSEQPRRIPWWPSYAGIRRGNDGVPAWVDRLRGLGNAVVPQIPEMIARRIKQALEAA